MRWPLTQRLSSESSEAIIGPMSDWPTRPRAVLGICRNHAGGLSRRSYHRKNPMADVEEGYLTQGSQSDLRDGRPSAGSG